MIEPLLLNLESHDVLSAAEIELLRSIFVRERSVAPGEDLVSPPETFLLTFWVMAKKPRFAAAHDMTVVLPEEMLVIGSGRYVAKPREQMEYLNFEVSRESLTKIAMQTEPRFKLGDQDFTFTRNQMKLLADLLTVTSVEPVK